MPFRPICIDQDAPLRSVASFKVCLISETSNEAIGVGLNELSVILATPKPSDGVMGNAMRPAVEISFDRWGQFSQWWYRVPRKIYQHVSVPLIVADFPNETALLDRIGRANSVVIQVSDFSRRQLNSSLAVSGRGGFGGPETFLDYQTVCFSGRAAKGASFRLTPGRRTPGPLLLLLRNLSRVKCYATLMGKEEMR